MTSAKFRLTVISTGRIVYKIKLPAVPSFTDPIIPPTCQVAKKLNNPIRMNIITLERYLEN